MDYSDGEIPKIRIKGDIRIKWLKVSIASLIIFVIAPILFWMLFLNHIAINEVGAAYNMVSGKVTVQDQPGWYMTNPWTFVYDLSTLPFKVALPSKATLINEKVIRFKPEGIQEYVRLQGFDWGFGGSSFENIMMGYAYSGKEWPFLEIIQEAGAEKFDTTKIDWPKSSEKSNEK